MSDSLRDRLIAAVTAASPVSHRFIGEDGYLSVAIRSDEDAAAIAVDAVIAELGLREELRYPHLQPHWSFTPPQRHRYVTEWENDHLVEAHEDVK